MGRFGDLWLARLDFLEDVCCTAPFSPPTDLPSYFTQLKCYDI